MSKQKGTKAANIRPYGPDTNVFKEESAEKREQTPFRELNPQKISIVQAKKVKMISGFTKRTIKNYVDTI